jgi:uncharacterized membrane protein YhaH (DUF805 family)
MQWYLLALRNYAVFKGRARRREYWIFELMNSAIVLALFAFAVALGKVGYPYFLSLPFLYVAATTIPSLSSLIRRLHDTNRTAWWLFISVLPVVGPFILLGFIVTDSDPGENRFGPNPKRQSTTEPTSGNPEMGYLAPPIDRR